MDENTIAHRLNFGYACYKRKHRDGVWTDEDWIKFTTRDDFWRWVCGKVRDKTKLYLFCHNTSFDLPVLNVFKEMRRNGYTLKSAIIDAPPTILRFCSGSKSIVILDTLNIWRMPLRYLGEEIGLPKLDMPDNNDLGIDWDNYARRDVEIIMTACIKWWKYLQDEDMGSFAPTLAGQSMQAYRHKYMHIPILLDANVNALALTREGYYGGRVECFRVGRYQQSFSALDVNSMYPAAMSAYEYPCKLVAYTHYATVEDIEIWLRKYCVTAKVRLRTEKPFAPIRQDNKLIFPIGTFECILSTPELRYALEHAEILSVSEVSVYHRAHLFTDMVKDMVGKKVEAQLSGDRVREFLYKKLINSFYGKWGQSGGKWLEDSNIEDLECKQWIEYDVESGKKTRFRQMGGLVQVKGEETESRDSFPAIAGHVTAYARMMLWGMIETANTSNVWYMDTDCLVVNDEGRALLSSQISSTILGALKVAGEYDDIEIWGAKDYRFGSKVRTKGVRKNAVWLDGHKVRQEQWSGLRGLVRSGHMDAPTTKTVTKNLARIYSKGSVQQDGSVNPFRLDR